MLELIFGIAMLWIFGKLFIFGIKAAWGITKILFTVIFLPVILIGMVLGGLIYIATPILVVIGIITLLRTKS